MKLNNSLSAQCDILMLGYCVIQVPRRKHTHTYRRTHTPAVTTPEGIPELSGFSVSSELKHLYSQHLVILPVHQPIFFRFFIETNCGPVSPAEVVFLGTCRWNLFFYTDCLDLTWC